MIGRQSITLASFAIFLGIASGLRADTNIKSFVCEKLDDFTANATMIKADQRELGKISKDFGLAFRIHDVKMSYKEPNMVRMEGSAEGSKVGYILTGTKQIVMINGRKLTERNFDGSPGKRKSLMDVGLVSDFYLTYTNAKFLRNGTVDETPVAVFDMTYKDRDEDTSHHIIYIDPKTKVVLKRESYSQNGKLQAIFFFKKVVQVKPGIWMPTEVEVQNTDRIVAGITAYKDIKVNVGVADSVFKP
ncbi:MAG: outer membrane lipoprotein-sorting protein [Chthonomonadales bacterium]